MTMSEFSIVVLFTVITGSLYLVNSLNLEMSNFPEYQNKDDVLAVAKSQNKFTKDLYLALAKGSNENLFFSPFSISTALAMVYIAAQGETDSQMKSVMHLVSDKSSIRKAFFDLITDFKKEASEYELRTSNMAYISKKLSVLDEYASALTTDFLSSSKLVDFDNSEPVRKEINDVVEKETNSKIKDLIPSGVLNTMTRMVLVNAVYFKGLWLNQFNPEHTVPAPFWVTKDESVDVPMMTVEKEFRVAKKEELDATLLALDYKGGRMSFVILLPNERDGLAALEQKLTSVDLASLDSKITTSKIKVSLPKFKLEETLELVKVLKSMGMTNLFSAESADLSGINGNTNLYVSNVIHKAFLEVNEKGAEAAAATAVVVMTRMALRPPRPFVADHPFVFFIRDRLSNVVLFAGRYIKP